MDIPLNLDVPEKRSIFTVKAAPQNYTYSEGFVDGFKVYHEIRGEALMPGIWFLAGGIFAALAIALLQRCVRNRKQS
jgi:hypothetical protein